jgi:hypothetical protein
MPQVRHQRCDVLQVANRSTPGMDASDARKLKALEDENRKLKKLLAGSVLGVASDYAALASARARQNKSWDAPDLYTRTLAGGEDPADDFA